MLAPADTDNTPNDVPKITNATPTTSDADTMRRAPGARKYCMWLTTREGGLTRTVLAEALHTNLAIERGEHFFKACDLHGEP